jgi:acetoin utilization deacetylase AcuC-like enzyme
VRADYCYLNNAAIAAVYLSPAGRIAILDVDYHHGNGTQSIFYDTDQILYVSIHADPAGAYPYYSGHANERGEGKGVGFNVNLPLPSSATDEQYAQALEQALSAVRDFAPVYLIVSLGLDTYRDDPICDFRLSSEFFGSMAGRIAALDVPSLIALEGGYNIEEVGHLAVNFVRGW